ncbi:hypothetical protein [Ornithinibacillus californiensis]|jgi:hypothetical protein|nr:hypothetical protein [Ornithinibacillus californiensis]
MDEYYYEIDRMINEGLGGGFIFHDNHWRQFDIPYDSKLINRKEEEE